MQNDDDWVSHGGMVCGIRGKLIDACTYLYMACTVLAHACFVARYDSCDSESVNKHRVFQTQLHLDYWDIGLTSTSIRRRHDTEPMLLRT